MNNEEYKRADKPEEPCDDAISRQSVLDLINSDWKYENLETDIVNLPSVTSQSKMGCEGCKFEKTGNNSTYPCSHCSRCYTDKFKTKSEEQYDT